MIGGAAMLRPSWLHIGTAALAGAPKANTAIATNVASRSLTARALRRVSTGRRELSPVGSNDNGNRR